MPSSSKSTMTQPNHGSPVPADRSIEIGEGHEPYGATCLVVTAASTFPSGR
jgi:hypothetical protein